MHDFVHPCMMGNLHDVFLLLNVYVDNLSLIVKNT
jgi:hypothetical protein